MTIVNKRLSKTEYDPTKEHERWFWGLWTIVGMLTMGWYLEGNKTKARMTDYIWVMTGMLMALMVYYREYV
jgi:hypothetical protein